MTIPIQEALRLELTARARATLAESIAAEELELAVESGEISLNEKRFLRPAVYDPPKAWRP